MPSPRRIAQLLVLALAALAPTSGSAEEPFQVEPLLVPGRPVDAICVGGWLVVASVEGSPPREKRWLTRFPPADLGLPSSAIPVDEAVVAFDVAELGPGEGPEIALLSARSLVIHSGAGLAARDIRLLDPPLPLPPRTRQVSRMALLGDWDGDGAKDALLPGLAGARWIPLDHRPPRALSARVIGHYVTRDGSEDLLDGWARARIIWPQVTRGNDDGDGRTDIFAVHRFGLSIFRGSPNGPSSQPTRELEFEPFSAEEERRHRSTWQRGYVGDVNGDSLSDLVLHRTVGTMAASRAQTVVRLNGGSGLDPGSEPAAVLESTGGFATLDVLDLDGNGRAELIETSVSFGIPQVLRVLTRRRVEAVMRIYTLDPEAESGVRQTWKADLSYGIDFETARIQGILPSMSGDWNGDGLRDLLHADGPERARIRLGEQRPEGPAFGKASVAVPLPASEGLVVGDLDRDGLDDFVVWDSLDEEGRLWRMHNRGVLPTAIPVMRKAETDSP